jgi:hypothetical protein
MHLKRNQITDILLIIISAISLIASFSLSLDYISWIAVLLCGTPIFKECIEGLITEFDIKADLLVSMLIPNTAKTGIWNTVLRLKMFIKCKIP